MAEQELGYHEALALLPAYAAGQLGNAGQAAVDDYLQRQIALFRRLDELEEAAGGTKTTTAATASTATQHMEFAQSVPDDNRFARVMEGQSAPEPDNPLLMRTAPQAYVDEETGQRYIVPRRTGTVNTEPLPIPQPSGNRGIWQTLWSLLALATIVGVVFIALYHRNLQQTIGATQAQLLELQSQMTLISGANRALSLRANDRAMQGTLLIRERQASLVVNGLEPLGSDQRYQLWIRTSDGSQFAAAQLPSTENQLTQWFTLNLPTDGNLVVGAAINIEATGIVTTPTSPMLIESAP